MANVTSSSNAHHTFNDTDRRLMSLALAQGRLALPACLPNPPVGCVIAHNGTIVAGGYTQAPGGHHAEAMALSQLEPERKLDELTVYVTLEPCSFAGRPPPAHAPWRRQV
ncbi:MAG: deaminase [Ectopseudomonas guguanensis]|uniref:deaminase n=1 Tax=Ectopseudomonas guguanensis TaxID=1198456 RepID=UPI00391B7540